MHWVIGIQNLVPAVDPQVAHELAPRPVSHGLRAPEVNLANLERLETLKGPVTGLLSQPQYSNGLAGTEMVQETFFPLPLEKLKGPYTWLKPSPSHGLPVILSIRGPSGTHFHLHPQRS